MNDIGTAARAEALLSSGHTFEAIQLVETAARADDAGALFMLTAWLLTGNPVPRDLSRARAVLRRCVEIGHVDGALLEIALTATGSGGPPDWARARNLLQRAAETDPVARQQLDLIEAMHLDADGRPTQLPRGERLSASPDVQRFPALLTPAECEHLAMAVQDLLQPAVVVDPRTGKMISHPIRTSHGAVVGPARETLVIRAINMRIAAISGTMVEQGEPLAVLHYAPGQQYRPHHDSIAGAANQRIKTVLVYLNQGYRGGETQFMANSLKVQPRGGDAILFSNTRADGAPDRRAEHAGLPVSAGVKWLATRWIRAAPHDPWNPA